MNLPKCFPELKELLEKMGAPFRPFKPEIDIRLKKEGVPISKDQFVIVDRTPIFRNRKVALYLRDAWAYRKKYNNDPKYHVVHCKILQRMEENGHYHRFHATRRTDGKFLVNLSDTEELHPLKLNICKKCLEVLAEPKQYGSGVFPTDPGEFPLADWFETFDGSYESTLLDPPHVQFDYSSEAWQSRSLACREKAKWVCQQCNMNLESSRHFLHAHHKWGTRYNRPEDLIALCIGCHAKQSGGGHQMLTDSPEHQEFMEKYGKYGNN